MSNDIKAIQSYFPDLSEEQVQLLERYVGLLLETNNVVNLISRKNTEEVWVNHILHALSLSKIQSFDPGSTVVDVGTGGGLPGIPMAICFPETNFMLVDSIRKKTRAVEEMARSLGLRNVSVKHARIEELDQRFDYAISRAVTALPRMYEWLQGKIQPGKAGTLNNGLIYIKGGDFEEELDEIDAPYQVWHMSDWFNEPFFETKKIVWLDTNH